MLLHNKWYCNWAQQTFLSQIPLPFPNSSAFSFLPPPLSMSAVQAHDKEGLLQSVAAAEATVYKPVNQEGLLNHHHQLFPEI